MALMDDNFDDCPLIYVDRCKVTYQVLLSKPVVLQAANTQVGFLFESTGGENGRLILFEWLNDRRMTVEYGNPWDRETLKNRYKRPNGTPTNSSRFLSHNWVFGFDTPEQAMEFKLRWL